MKKLQFRQEVMDKIAGPDELDKILQVTTPKAWIALAGFMVVIVALLIWGILGSFEVTTSASGILVQQEGAQTIQTNTQGRIQKIYVKPGMNLKRGQVVAKIQNSVTSASVEVISPYDGVVNAVVLREGAAVQPQTTLAKITLAKPQFQSVVFVPFTEKDLHPGMPVQLSLATNNDQSGNLVGTISSISDYPVSATDLLPLVKNSALAAMLASSGLNLQVNVVLQSDANSPDGYKWSSGKPTEANLLSDDTLVNASVVIGSQRPIGLILPIFNNTEGGR